MLTTPVLLIIFNRPKITQLVFDAIKQQKPKQLFVAADGPRQDKKEDIEKCRATRKIIEQVDWNCDLKTLYRDENIGCGYGPSKGISWFFEHVEEGIILEDDCLPSPSFFTYCTELLCLYKTNEDIYMINGFNSLGRWNDQNQSYFKTHISASWGWATWKRAWGKFEYNIDGWKIQENKAKILNALGKQKYFNQFGKDFDHIVKHNPSDIWDVQWLYARLFNNGMTLNPALNLVSNIGFGLDSTHTISTTTILANSPIYKLSKPYKAFKNRRDWFFEYLVFERFYYRKKKSFFKKTFLKFIRIWFKTN